jgi:hypothetical protein
MDTPYLMTSGDIVGCYVSNRKAENLGKIEDIVVDLQSGQIEYAILAFDELWGLPGKLLAVPWATLGLPNPDMATPTFSLDMDREALKAAPAFATDRWPDMTDPGWRNEIAAYYNRQQPGEGTIYVSA